MYYCRDIYTRKAVRPCVCVCACVCVCVSVHAFTCRRHEYNQQDVLHDFNLTMTRQLEVSRYLKIQDEKYKYLLYLHWKQVHDLRIRSSEGRNINNFAPTLNCGFANSVSLFHTQNHWPDRRCVAHYHWQTSHWYRMLTQGHTSWMLPLWIHVQNHRPDRHCTGVLADRQVRTWNTLRVTPHGCFPYEMKLTTVRDTGDLLEEAPSTRWL